MRFPFLAFFFLFILQSLAAQTNSATLSGRIVDEADGAPLPYAMVTALSPQDSAVIAGAYTNDAGEFSLLLAKGAYLLQVDFVGYGKLTMQEVTVDQRKVNLGDIALSAKSLDAVEIEADANQMSLQLDKRVFNVGKDLSNAGRNAQEILDNIPSVNVDVDGNISLRGSENVRILVDGKPSGLVGVGSTDGLRSLQGTMIESIEVVTNPSARYDAEGEVGIINIVLKKEQRTGVNGSFELTAGWPHNHRAGLNLNFRKQKFNLFTNAAVGYDSRPGQGASLQYFDLVDTSFSYERDRQHLRGGWNQSFQFGSDFFLNERNTMTVSGLYRGGLGNNLATLDYRDFDQFGTLTQVSSRVDDEIETKQVFEGAVNYTKTYAEKRRKWVFDVKWTQSDDTEKSDILQTSDIESDVQQRVSNTEDERTFFLQTDYVHPLAKQGQLEMGLRSTIRRILNDYGVDELDNNGTWQPLPDFNNNFLYDENIYAGYVQAGNQSGPWSYQAGLRAEYSQIRTQLLDTGEENPRDYMNLFPSAAASYQLDEKKTLQVSYSRRISRPRFRNLLPFSSFSDNRNFRGGNPDLDPEFTHSTEMGYLQYFKSGSLLSSLYYRYRTGVIQRVNIPDSTGFTLMIPVNLATQQAYGLEFNTNVQPWKWLKLTGNFNFYREITDGTYGEQDLSADTYTWNTRLTSKVSFLKDWEMQATFDYRAPQQSPQGRTLSRYHMDLGIEKDVLKKKGTLIFSASDLFNTRFYRWEVESDGYFSTNSFQWRSRQFLLTFNYRLNQDKKRSRGGRGEGGGGDDF